MKLGEADLQDSFFQRAPKGGERSLGFILAAVIVVFFFSVFLYGMMHVQDVSNQVTSENRTLIATPNPEIGGPTDARDE